MSGNDLDIPAQPAKLRTERACKFKASIYKSQQTAKSFFRIVFANTNHCKKRTTSLHVSTMSHALFEAMISLLSATLRSSHSHLQISPPHSEKMIA